MLYLQKATQVTFSPDNDLDGLADVQTSFVATPQEEP